jgi:predicted phage replisome organizer
MRRKTKRCEAVHQFQGKETKVMADVKWIKITTDVFDDEKILLIESLPDAYAIITVWFKLLCLAGKQNNSGVFMMGQMPYTDKMLATIFRMKEATVTMAIQTFEQFGMVEVIDGVITIPNWNKHQTLDAYEKKKVRDRLYQAERRAAQKALVQKSSDKSSDVAISEEDIDKDIDKDIEINNIISDSAEPEQPTPKKPKPVKHKYGEYKNVLLTDEELQKLKTEYSDYQDRIERLSSYVASTGKSYKSHYATIRNWARKDAEKPGRKEIVPDWMNKQQTGFNNFEQRNYDMGAMEQMLLEESKPKEHDPALQERVEQLKERLGVKEG